MPAGQRRGSAGRKAGFAGLCGNLPGLGGARARPVV